MILSKETVQFIFDSGLTQAQIAELMHRVSTDVATFTLPSAGAERTRRWREKKEADRHEASPTVTERHQEPASPTVTERHKTSPGDASRVVDITLPTEITGKKERKEPLSSNDDFELAWKAYPHIKGRSSKRKTRLEWPKIPVSIRRILPAAIRRYAAEGREPSADCGAAAMERWLHDERYLDWLPVTEVITPKSPEEQAEQDAKWKAYTDRLETANA